MTRKFALAFAVLAFLLPLPANAQQTTKVCVPVAAATGQLAPSCQDISTTFPLPVAPSPSAAASAGITPVVCGSAVSSCVLKATPGNLYSVYADCTAACWLQVFNAVAAPVNGATTAGVAANNMVECISIAAGGIGGISYGSGPPAVYSTGITVAVSSTSCATLTLSTVGFIHGLIQ
jgi:hypothetical protein